MSEKKPKIQGQVEAVIENPQNIRLQIRYSTKDPRGSETLLLETLPFDREHYGEEVPDWQKIERDARKHMKDQVKELRKGLKVHPLLGIIEEEEPEPKGK